MDFLSILKDKKRIRGTLIVIFLLAAIPLTIYLVFQQQIFKSKALGEGSTLQAFAASGAELPDNNPQDGIPETQSQIISLKLTWNPGASSPTPSPTRTPTPTTSQSTPTATTAPGQPTPVPTTTVGDSCTACTADLIRNGIVDQDDLTIINTCKNITIDINSTFDSYLASNPQYSTFVTLCRSMDLNSSNKTEQSEVDCVQRKLNQTCSQNNAPTPVPTATAPTSIPAPTSPLVSIGSISGYVYSDTNGDGVRQANEGIPGISVVACYTPLLISTQRCSEIVPSVYTDAEGYYIFSNIYVGVNAAIRPPQYWQASYAYGVSPATNVNILIP